MDKNTVILNTDLMAISIADYDDLKTSELILDAVEDVIFRNASLSWDKKSLNFDDRSLCCVLQVLFPAHYNTKLRILKEQEEKKDGTDKDRE